MLQLWFSIQRLPDGYGIGYVTGLYHYFCRHRSVLGGDLGARHTDPFTENCTLAFFAWRPQRWNKAERLSVWRLGYWPCPASSHLYWMTVRSALHFQRLHIINTNTMTPVEDYRNSPSLQPSFCHTCYWQICLHCRSVLPLFLLLPTHVFQNCDGSLRWTPSRYYNRPLPPSSYRSWEKIELVFFFSFLHGAVSLHLSIHFLLTPNLSKQSLGERQEQALDWSPVHYKHPGSVNTYTKEGPNQI